MDGEKKSARPSVGALQFPLDVALTEEVGGRFQQGFSHASEPASRSGQCRPFLGGALVVQGSDRPLQGEAIPFRKSPPADELSHAFEERIDVPARSERRGRFSKVGSNEDEFLGRERRAEKAEQGAQFFDGDSAAVDGLRVFAGSENRGKRLIAQVQSEGKQERLALFPRLFPMICGWTHRLRGLLGIGDFRVGGKRWVEGPSSRWRLGGVLPGLVRVEGKAGVLVTRVSGDLESDPGRQGDRFILVG